jgi:hypothetical protein
VLKKGVPGGSIRKPMLVNEENTLIELVANATLHPLSSVFSEKVNELVYRA